mgnify:CR=1 FL=1
MSTVVDLTVADPVEAASYYESLLAVTPDANAGNGTRLAESHVTVRLHRGKGDPLADTTLNVTSGMLSRILDVAMTAQCVISVDSAEQVRFTDRYGQRWTLRCQLS